MLSENTDAQFRDFKRASYSVAQEMGIAVLGFQRPLLTPNFHACLLEKRNVSLALLCSVHDDWAIVSDYSRETCHLAFHDDRDIAGALLSRFGIHVLSKRELLGPFEKRSWMNQADIDYWQPKNLGEGLFNWWD